MTSGYTITCSATPRSTRCCSAIPFRQWTPQDPCHRDVEAADLPAGTNWNYARTNYLILGLALEKITGKKVRRPDAGKGARSARSGEHLATRGRRPSPSRRCTSFTSERKPFLGIPEGTRFYEESTFWNPSWTITQGAIQTSNIYDLNDTANVIGTGKLLSPGSLPEDDHADLRGKTTVVPGCATCFVQDKQYAFGTALSSPVTG